MSDSVFSLENVTRGLNKIESGLFNRFHEIGAIRFGHFQCEFGKFERHSPVCVNHDLIYVHSETMESWSGAIANYFRGGNVEVVIGSEGGGRHLAAVVSAAMRRQILSPQRPFFILWAEKQGEGFVISKELERFVYGKRVLVVEDVVMTGASLKSVVDEVRRCRGEPFAAAAIWNRGGKRAKDFGVGTYFSLIDVQLPDWPAHECPLCRMGNPLSLLVGHAVNLPTIPGHCGIGVPSSQSPCGTELQVENPSDPEHTAPPDDPEFKNRIFD